MLGRGASSKEIFVPEVVSGFVNFERLNRKEVVQP
jgi:hypothetical protein